MRLVPLAIGTLLSASWTRRCCYGLLIVQSAPRGRPAARRHLPSLSAAAASHSGGGNDRGMLRRSVATLARAVRHRRRLQAKPPANRRRRAVSLLATLAICTALCASVGASGPAVAEEQVGAGICRVLGDLCRQLLEPGARRDSMTLLLATATVIPLAKAAGLSPILGFLATGVALGPNGLGVVTELSTTEALAELGVVFFLFEMGLELSMERLGAMKREIFGLGLAQFVATMLIVGKLVHVLGGGSVSATAAGLAGGALALSSSAFVLQLLRDQDELGTTHGRASLGVLLLQDLAVVPLLVLTPLLAGGGSGSVIGPLVIAALKAVAAVVGVEFLGKRVLNRAFERAARSGSQEAFLSVIFLAALGVSGLTESIGLSDTLGAFLAGVSLSETKYSSKVEADVAPFRGMLLGLFFVTVGFSIDVQLVAAKPVLLAVLAASLLSIKAVVLCLLGLAFGLPVSSALRSGCLLAQGGEFGFVAFGLANRLGLLGDYATRLLLTTVALSMAATPLVAGLGASVARFLDDDRTAKRRSADQLPQAQAAADPPLPELPGSDAVAKDEPDVVVVGYGRLGRVVCETLDAKLRRYVVIEKDAAKATAARRDGRPVYQGDLTVANTHRKFRVNDARLAVVAINGNPVATNAVVLALKRNCPQLKVVARAADQKHARRLRRFGETVVPIVPALRDDSRLLALPFGGAVLRGLGCRADDVDMLIEEKRRAILGPIYPRDLPSKDPATKVSSDMEPSSATERDGTDQTSTRDDEDDDDEPKPLMAQCLSEDALPRDEALKIALVTVDDNKNETALVSSL